MLVQAPPRGQLGVSVVQFDSGRKLAATGPPLPVPRRAWLVAILLAAGFFVALAPTLSWCEFTGGMENFNVETALEMTRDGHWIVPTLDGQVRTKKPPLAEWITALGILSSRSLAWGARWPSLLCAALTLIGVYELGRLAGGPRLGLVSMCICGSTYLFLKFAREASYDTQVAFWVTASNVFIAWIVLRGRWWVGCMGAGIALGLALMTKGPPAILETVAPAVVLVIAERSIAVYRSGDEARKERRGFSAIMHAGTATDLEVRDDTSAPPHPSPLPEGEGGGRRPVIGAVVTGVLLALAVALPWTLYVMSKQPGQVAEWYNEVSLGTEARFERRIGVYFSYLAFVFWIIPWTVWFMAAVGWIAFGRRESEPENGRERRGLHLMLAWVLVPLIVMWFFPERRDRYLLPLIPPTAVLCGWAVLKHLSDLRRSSPASVGPRWPLGIHWATVAAIGLGLPLLGLVGVSWFRTADGRPWFSAGLSAALAGLVILTLVACVQRRQPGAPRLVGGTFVVMLLVQAAFTWGYARSASGISESKRFVEPILAQYPGAIVYNANNRSRRRDLPLEMTIYLNRVVPRAEQPERLEPTDRPQVIIFPDGACRAPDGFKPAARRFIKEEWWNAFVLPARG